jgi:hypothetical protein
MLTPCNIILTIILTIFGAERKRKGQKRKSEAGKAVGWGEKN